jgi:rhamnogalacturonan endolyase
VGVILSDTYTPTNQTFQQYWFLRGEETGLHMFTRVSYYNSTTPFLRNLQELRTLFRPNSGLGLWTHLSTNEKQTAPLPSPEALEKGVVVQDATWSLEATPEDPYVTQFSRWFTKYTFSTGECRSSVPTPRGEEADCIDWRNHTVHGLFADGSTSNGTAYGAWLVMNTRDTYFGGPLHSDLTVDGIVYNYIVSNHHGEGTPNITHGFDRTFGPQYYYFNSAPGGTISSLRADAEALASPEWNTQFYDTISAHVVGFIPSSGRGSWNGHIILPKPAKRAIAVLTVSGKAFQDNSADPTAHQYWGEIDSSSSGRVSIDRIVAGTYRLTVYADGVFGEFIQDNIVIEAGSTTSLTATWTEESAGTELWRLGTPDKSSGEFRHGVTPDTRTPLAPPEYLIFWGGYDFPDDFPEGVNYTVGVSDPAMDWNYVHWSVFGPTPSRPEVETVGTANWTINFSTEESQLRGKKTATITLQLAAVKGAAGNTDIQSPTEPYADVPLSVWVNDKKAGVVVVPWYKSSSCAVRSAVSCYQVSEKLRFPAEWLLKGWNRVVLGLPRNATDTETAVLPTAVYVQYDAVRLEVS